MMDIDMEELKRMVDEKLSETEAQPGFKHISFYGLKLFWELLKRRVKNGL